MPRPSAEAGRDRGAVQSVERALALIDLLAREQGGLTLTEICQLAGLHTSTAYRLLATLAAHGFVRRDPERRTYRLGLHLLHLGEAARAQCDLREEAAGTLQSLAHRTRELANLVVPSGNRAIYISQAHAQSELTVRMFTQVGAWVPLHCTAVGKAIIAHWPDEDLEQLTREGLPAHTPNTITSPERLQSELAAIRQRGYAIDDEEREVGVRCIASPVFDAEGQVVAALSISGPAGRVTPDRFAELGETVREAAARLSERLGFSGHSAQPRP